MSFQWVPGKLVLMVGLLESWHIAVIIKKNKDMLILRLILKISPAEKTVS